MPKYNSRLTCQFSIIALFYFFRTCCCKNDENKRKVINGYPRKCSLESDTFFCSLKLDWILLWSLKINYHSAESGNEIPSDGRLFVVLVIDFTVAFGISARQGPVLRLHGAASHQQLFHRGKTLGRFGLKIITVLRCFYDQNNNSLKWSFHKTKTSTTRAFWTTWK